MGRVQPRSHFKRELPESGRLRRRRLLRGASKCLAFTGSLLVFVASQSSCEKSKKSSDPLPVGEESEEGVVSTGDQPSGGGRSARPSASVKPIAASSSQDVVAVEGLGVLAAKPGEVVEVTGSNLQAGVMALIGDIAVDLKVESATQASFVMPQGVSAGLVDVDFKFAAQDLQRFSLISDSAGDNLPIMLIDPSQICQDISYRDAKGEVKQGQRLCQINSIAACSADGATGCVANSTFPAVNIANFVASDVKAGKTVAGVVGSLSDCFADGGSNCVATTTYRAALTTGLAAKVVSGNTVAGVPGASVLPAKSSVLLGVSVGVGDLGTVVLPGTGDVRAGITFGANSSLTGQLDPGAGMPASCNADNQVNCVANPNFPAAKLAGFLASDLRAGKTVAGVAGALNNCAADGGLGCVATLTYRAALTTGLAPKVVSGNTVAGVTGSAIAESHSNCTMDGGVGCVTVANFKAADMTRVSAGNIKSGVTIAGVTGAFPSATYSLPGADATTDLDFATFDARIKSSMGFEWFDSAGTRYTNTGDADIQPGNIANGVTIFGATGTLANGSNCTADGQINCITTSRYKSMDTDVSVISSWDIRKGKTAGGLAGEIVFYRNMANTAVFNRISGTGALAGVDIYDTIEDYNGNNAFPTQNPAGWDQAMGANWLRDSVSDTGVGGGVEKDGVCNGSEICVYQDRITGLFWLRDDGAGRTWESAITYCDGLTIGGYSDWRLPTQKELLIAYANGVWSRKDAWMLNIYMSSYWSSSTYSQASSYAWIVTFPYGVINNSGKTANFRVLCVR